MTDKPTPTDAEILDAAEDFRSQYTHGGTTFDEFDEIGFARAVLAKWGQPAQETKGRKVFVCTHCDGVYADQPVTRCDCLPDENTFTEGWICFGAPAQAAEPVAWLSPWRKDQVTTDYDAYGKQGIPLYAAPQPVAREPLSAAQKQHTHNETGAGHALICLVESYLLDANGIKGGQHGTK